MKKTLIPLIILFSALSCSKISTKNHNVAIENFGSRIVKTRNVNIVSVRSMDQSCSGALFNSNASQPHKDSKKIIATGEIDLPDLGFKINVPQLYDTKNTFVTIALNNKDRGILDNYIWLNDKDYNIPSFAAIVISILPQRLQNRSGTFGNVELYDELHSKKVNVKSIKRVYEGKYGETLEFIIQGRVGTFCFPTAGYKILPKEYNIRTMGISRYVVINSKLIEFSLIVTIPKNYNLKQATSLAREEMDKFEEALVVLK